MLLGNFVLLDPYCDVPNILENNQAKKTIVEIGFGNGEFLAFLAKKYQDSVCFGIEVSKKCIQKASKRLVGYEQRVFLMLGDAKFLLRECFPDESIDHIYMNFPCPWPKTKHEKRRVTSGGFPKVLASVLKTGGVFEVVTDDENYALEIENIFSNYSTFDCLCHNLNEPREISTKYERKWKEEGKVIHTLRFVKTKKDTLIRMTEEGNDVHAIVKLDNLTRESFDKIRGVKGARDASRWCFGDCYESENRILLLEVVVSDEDFHQQIYFRLVPRKEDWLIKVDPAVKAFATPAVKGALEHLRRFLEENGG